MPDLLSPLPYAGGKRCLWRNILALLEGEAEGHQIEYREPFLGGGDIALRWLAIHRGCRAWLNDLNPLVAAFWLAVQSHTEALCHLLGIIGEVDEEQFNLYTAVARRYRGNPASLTEEQLIRLAAQTLIFAQGTGGRFKGFWEARGTRGTRGGIASCFSRIRKAAQIINACDVRITNLDYLALMDGPALYFLDPPYPGPPCHDYPFDEAQHREFAAVLRPKPAWVLCYNDKPLIQELYLQGQFCFERHRVVSSAATKRKGRQAGRTELLITPK